MSRVSRRLGLAGAIVTVAVLMQASAAGAAVVPSALGIPCAEQSPGGVQFCQGDNTTRVPTWDGVPLDTNVTLPPAAQDGPYPLIVFLHGWGGSKQGASTHLAEQGYAVLSYTARGFGNSCGTPDSRLGVAGCDKGWIHLADARYEGRDTQFLAGKLVDEDLAEPAIGVTGVSYGGGQSMILATLKDRVMLPDGTLIPWTSPEGTPMHVAAAAPIIPWSDLAMSLMPNGRKLDYQPNASYGTRVGIGKQSWLTLLYSVGLANFYAPPGADPEADITHWFAQIQQGEPYDDVELTEFLLDQVRRYHSAYYLQDRLAADQREAPAPLLIYNAWTDDLFPADESLSYASKVHSTFPSAEINLFYAAAGGHSRADLTALFGDGQSAAPGLSPRVDQFWGRHLQSLAGSPFGVETYTQGCGADPVAQGPFTTATWAQQHPGEVRVSSAATQPVSALGGNPATASLVDPFNAEGQGGCPSAPAFDEPGVANYRTAAATGSGFTLLGSPTVIARIETTDPFAQVQARLWDVGTNGQERFVTRGTYRPDVGSSALQVFQLHPNGWHFAPGHVAKLELLGRDSPYGRPSNSIFSEDVSQLELRLPVQETPDGGQILPPKTPVNPPPAKGALSGRCANTITGTPKQDELSGTNRGDRIRGRAGNDTLDGRGGRDCLLPGPGQDKIVGGSKGDLIVSRDHARDRIRCGPGRDTVKADRRDLVRGCERVRRPAH